MNSHPERTITTPEWFFTLLLCVLPGVNAVFLLVWAFSPGIPASKRNFARAAILLALVSAAILLAIQSLR